MKITDKMIKDISSSTIYSRGNEYFKSGRVHLKNSGENEIKAMVDGSRIYNVQMQINDDKIDYMFCTCPYFTTMNCACKHIVAAAKQYQAECDGDGELIDKNTQLAQMLCDSFVEKSYKTEILPLTFILNIVTPRTGRDTGRYVIEIKNKITGKNFDIAKFISAYITRSDCKLGSMIMYSPKKHSLTAFDKSVMDFLAQMVQDISIINFTALQVSSFRLSIGAVSAKQLMKFENINLEIWIDNQYYPDIQKYYENPDILIDINAHENNINMSVMDTGTALTIDGEVFLFEGDIYITDAEFRRWYMPIYNAFSSDRRTQLDFKGDNAVQFIKNVHPHIKDRHGVTSNGLDRIIVNNEPIFSVYFDKYTADGFDGISAVIRVAYGDILFTLPDGHKNNEKILIRNIERENELLAFFDKFTRLGDYHILNSSDDIYEFITEMLPEIIKYSSVFYSESFKNISITKHTQLSLSVNYSFDVDLFEASFDTELSNEEIAGILAAVRERKKFYRLKNGSFLSIDGNSELEMFDILDQLDFDEESIVNGRKNFNRSNIMYLAGFDKINFNKEFTEVYERFKNIKAEVPDYLQNILRGYQSIGVDWITQLSSFGFGGILADDMGLGKTLQVIAFVCSQEHTLPTLIITPSSLTYNWQNEIEKFAPSKRALIIEGNKSERKYRLSEYMDYDFIITSYPLLRRDIEIYEGIEFENCFIDEAQHIKNPKTMNAITVKSINAKHKFALTGTPIENSLTELWSIFDFIMPGYLYSHNRFIERFEKPVIKENDSIALEKLKSKISPFLLRRMKNDVLDELPEKIESVIYAELTSEQKKTYMAYMALAKQEFMELSDEGYAKNKIQILALLTRLRQICCHPVLFDTAYKKDSGKLELLEELLSEAISAGHRVIVFSQFTSMLDIIKDRLDKNNISYFYLSGKTSSADRADMADRFNEGENDVFLISLKAGGTGLNLTGADTVIHYDPWWNPAVMEQASDRVYRIGQKKNVQIIKLVSRGTIEEKIIMLQEKKKSLADGIITANQVSLGKLTKSDIMALLS